MITAKQIKAARALVGWKQSDLAEASGLAEVTIRVLEQGRGDPRLSTLQKIEAAFVKVGVRVTQDGIFQDRPA